MANTCLRDSFISVLHCHFGTLPEGKVGGETIASSTLECNRLGHGGIIGSLHQSLVRMVSCLCVLPGRSLCGLVFTHLPALPVQLKASGCLPNTDRRRLMQRPVKGQPSSCHSPQRSPTLNTHL